MNAVFKKIILVVLTVGFSTSAFAVIEKSFTCNNFEFITEDINNPVWVPMDNGISTIKLTPSEPLWKGVMLDSEGTVINSGDVPEVTYSSNAKESDVETLSISAAILGVDESLLGAYQTYTLSEDGGDGTGFFIIEFFNKDTNLDNPETLGSVFFLGWGYGRCQN